MMNESKNSYLSLDALKGMKSVRATFTLPKQTINMLTLVASQLGVKQKSIFDHLVENKDILEQVADEAQNYQPLQKKRKQKTFVLSKNSLKTLETFARTYKLSRDVIVEYSIKQLRPVIDKAKERHENRKTLLNELEVFRRKFSRLIQHTNQLVGENDESCSNLEQILTLYDRNLNDLKKNIQKGKSMEEFH